MLLIIEGSDVMFNLRNKPYNKSVLELHKGTWGPVPQFLPTTHILVARLPRNRPFFSLLSGLITTAVNHHHQHHHHLRLL